jgi:outer membrane protein assembly factor BamD (BamD/ComL family)
MANRGETTFRAARGRATAALAALVLIALAPGCKSWSSFRDRAASVRASLFDSAYEDPRAEEKMANADQFFGEGNYQKAQDLYRELAENQGNPTDFAERARFMQAECRYARRQYPEAVDTYHKLLIDFPTGPHRREAAMRMYEIADYWLDDFRVELEKRSGEKGVLRWKPRWPNALDRTKPLIDQEGRMLEAFEHIHTQDITGPESDKAIFWCGYVNYIRGNFQEADHFFSELIELHKDSPLRTQAISYAIQAKNNATGGPVYDTRKCAEALQLVYMAEASVPELTQNPEMAEKLTRAKFAIRLQQAEKDFRTAEYYERTGHPGSAVFYYELVRRRYAATKYADIATERKEHLIAAMREGRPLPGNDPFAVAKAKWREVFGKPEPVNYDENASRTGPTSPAGTVPSGAVPAGGAFQSGPLAGR